MNEYPHYKESRVPWLDKVPRHWQARRLKTLFEESEERKGQRLLTLLSLTRRRGIIPQSENDNGSLMAEDLSNYKVCCPTDVVMNRMQAWSGMFGVPPQEGIVSPDYSVFRAKSDCDVQFFCHLFKTPTMVDQFAKYSKGIGTGFNRLYWDQFGQIIVPVPPYKEQTTIVRYLDEADQRIQAYISAKEKLIALLEEQRQAIIHQAITRGLDTNVKLKPSGVEWLGEVPEHWDISRVKNEFLSLNHRRVPLSSVERGAMTESKYDYYGASGVIDKVDNYLFNDQLLLIAEDGANLLLRNLPLAIIARGKFWVNNHAHILKPKRGNLEFLASIMEGLNYSPWISGAAQPKLTQDRLMSISISVPSKAEQDKVIEDTVAATSNLTQGIEHARRQVKLMEEYRTSLIADVVTGKLDVRKATAELPDLEPTEIID